MGLGTCPARRPRRSHGDCDPSSAYRVLRERNDVLCDLDLTLHAPRLLRATRAREINTKKTQRVATLVLNFSHDCTVLLRAA